jgi:hypothetical protein
MLPTVTERKTYYGDPAIRARLDEFCESAVYIAVGTESASYHRRPCSVTELPKWLELGAEVNRSLWDRRALVAHLDIEYVNFDFAAAPYLEADRIFSLQEPVVREIESLLDQFGIGALHLLTGRGHHFVWRIDAQSRAFALLKRLGRPSDSLDRVYALGRGPEGEHVPPALGSAFSGLGLVIEFLAHRIKSLCAPNCHLPVELAAIEAGGGSRGREVISIDITEYADPLCSRVIRAPFSMYLKPWQHRHALGIETVERLAPMFLIPLNGMSAGEALRIRGNGDAVRQLAAGASTSIPEASAGTRLLIEAYLDSPLAQFHEWFYSQTPHPRDFWSSTYDHTPMDVLPPCVSRIFTHPNDLLLRPGCAERVVRVMLALGWHPRHIAGLIRSKYERDFAWGDQWVGYDPATRADFYARVFSGLFTTGVDDLVDFNCQSAREEGNCFVEHCSENLIPFRDSLINRRKYERLGCRPFNGLFLPNEHS